MQKLLLEAFSGDLRPATKEDVARLYSVIIHLRDIVMTQAGIVATMPLTSKQVSHFNETEMPMSRLQEAIGDGIIKLLGEKQEKSDE